MTTPAAAAAVLRTARLAGRTLPPFTDGRDDLDQDWAYDVQDTDRQEREADGEIVTGAKLGLTSAAKQRRMGVDRPVVGFLTAPMALEAGEVLSRSASWVQPRVEPEIAFVTNQPIDGGLTSAGAAALVGSVLMAAEILDSRYTGYRFRLPDVVADNTSAGGLVLGSERVALADLPQLATLGCRVQIDGEVVHEATGAAILGDPLEALVLLSRHVASRGGTLPAGSLVLAGALTDAVPLQAGHHYRLQVDHLGAVDLSL